MPLSNVQIPKFSVLLPVYKNDKLEYFQKAFESVYKLQTVKPSEILIVQDGPVQERVQKYLQKICKIKIVKLIVHDQNLGLPFALNAGLKKAKYNIVARVDADDICLKNRFEEQLKHISNNDIVGTFMMEFDGNKTGKIMKVPNVNIDKYAKLQTPLWHPTVMYKKDKILKLGGYEKIFLFEDYLLWAKALKNNFKIFNIQKVLVKHRVNLQLFNRRSGLKLFLSEIKLQKRFLQIGFINKIEFVKNILIRGLYRFFPSKLKNKLSQLKVREKLFG